MTSKSHESKEPPPADPDGSAADLVGHYRPLGLKAVLAAFAVKAPPPEPRQDEERDFGTQLPPGFHMPWNDYDD